MIHADYNVKIIAVLITGRVIAHFIAFAVLTLKLAAGFVNIYAAACYLRKIEHVRIGFDKVARARHHELARVLVKKHLGVVAKRPRRMEGSNGVTVLLAIIKLFLYLLNRALPPFREPRRKLGGTVFAKVAVLKLPVAKKAYLFTANVAVFLVKQSHSCLLWLINLCIMKTKADILIYGRPASGANAGLLYVMIRFTRPFCSSLRL